MGLESEPGFFRFSFIFSLTFSAKPQPTASPQKHLFLAKYVFCRVEWSGKFYERQKNEILSNIESQKRDRILNLWIK
jgi:hypothetical protein